MSFPSPGAFSAFAALTAVLALSPAFSQAASARSAEPRCAITAAMPSGSTVRLPAVGGEGYFAVAVSDSSCAPYWKLNGVVVGGSSSTRSVPSNQLLPGGNSLTVTAVNSSSSATRFWNLLKNSPPALRLNQPDFAEIAVGDAIAFSASASDADQDPLMYEWLLDGQPRPERLQVETGPAGTKARFEATSADVGRRKITAVAHDGFDRVEQSFEFNVVQPGAVTVVEKMPYRGWIEVSGSGSSSAVTFAVWARGQRLAYSWTLDDQYLVGQNGPSMALPGEAVGVGRHQVQVHVLDAHGNAAIVSWNVVRSR